MADTKKEGFLTLKDPAEKKLLNRLFWRSNLLQASTNAVAQQAHGVIYTMSPFLDEIYKDDEAERKAAYKRHSVYFLTNPYAAAVIWALLYILESKRGRDRDSVSEDTIQGIKVALMGPLAAIGDTLFQGSLGTIIAALCMGFAQEGSILGAVLQFVIWGAIMFGGKYIMLIMTYKKGESFVTDLLATNAFEKLTKVISVAGLMMMGVLTSTSVTFKLNWIITSGADAENPITTDIQVDLLDKILPGILPLCIVFVVFRLLKKRISPAYIIYGMMVLCIILSYLGIV